MMSDNKKYYYLKLKEDFFDSDEMIVLQAMPDGYLYSDILMKLYLRSLKSDGRLMFRDHIPYTPQMIAPIVRHQVGTVEKAIDVLQQLNLIEVTDVGAIFMSDIQNFIGESSSEGDRKRAYRARIASESSEDGTNVRQMSDKRPPENRDKRLEIKYNISSNDDMCNSESEKGKNYIDYQGILTMYNSTCDRLPKLRGLSDQRKKHIKARLDKFSLADMLTVFEKANESEFLAVQWGRCNFDWLMNETNFLKVLEGKYDAKNSADKAIFEEMMRDFA